MNLLQSPSKGTEWSDELLEGSDRSSEVFSAKCVFVSDVSQDAEVGASMPRLCFLEVSLTLY